MVNQLSQRQRFLLEWTILNVIGFMIGSFLGATDGGVVPMALINNRLPIGISDTLYVLLAKVAGDVLFGAAFGLSQVIVFRRHFPQSRALRVWLWIIASIIGFTLGVRLGARFAPQLAAGEPWVGLLFGVIVGGCLGIVEWAAIRWLGVLKTQAAYWWIPASIIAWIIGEAIAFASDFSQATVPLVAVGIALVTGLTLIWRIHPR